MKTLKDFLIKMSNNNLAVTGSYSYILNFPRLNFQYNDIDYISVGSVKHINFDDNENLILYLNDEFVQKGIFNKTVDFEIFYLSVVPEKYTVVKQGIKTVNKQWCYISKLFQLIRLFCNNSNKEKLTKVLNDLLIISNDLSIKLSRYRKRTIQKNLDIILISSSFLWFYKPSTAIKIELSKTNFYKLITWIRTKASKKKTKVLERYVKLIFWSTKTTTLLNKIKKFINNPSLFIDDFYKFNNNTLLDLHKIHQKFDDTTKIKNYINSFKLNFKNYKHCKIYFDCFSQIQHEDNFLDIRKMMFISIFKEN